MAKKITDLEKFIKIFQVDKFKTLSTGIEVRGISDLDKSVSDAIKIINYHGFKLTVRNTADMASYRAFEVLSL